MSLPLREDVSSLDANTRPSVITTPNPTNGSDQLQATGRTGPTGVLTIRIISGRGFALASDVQVTKVNHTTFTSIPAHQPTIDHDDEEYFQRMCQRWLPYVIVECDKSEVLVNALDGDLNNPIWNYQVDLDVSRTSTVTVTAYLRTVAQVQGQFGLGDDIFVARVVLEPILDSQQALDLWYPATIGSGCFHLYTCFKPLRHLTIDNFDLLKVIGKGSFGNILQVEKKDTKRVYVLKTIRKVHFTRHPERDIHTLVETTVLALADSPFIVPLKFSFETSIKLYLVMSFVDGGQLLFCYLQKEKKFDERKSRFYASELLLAFEHLHGFNIAYRGFTPENILLDLTGHIALCDFGLFQLNLSETLQRANSIYFHQASEYIAPELLQSRVHTKTVDWWVFGTLLYEMMTGLPPFYDENVAAMHQRILNDPLDFPPDMSAEAISILTRLLQRDPRRRLGANGVEEIKRHPFFARHTNWDMLLAKQIHPPFRPAAAMI